MVAILTVAVADELYYCIKICGSFDDDARYTDCPRISFISLLFT
jgi:hypothetical protein